MEEAARDPRQPPSREELQAIVNDLVGTLRDAADSGDPAELAALHDVVELLTGGSITLSQQGERKRHKGWLRATFRVRLLAGLLGRCGVHDGDDDGVEVELDVKSPPSFDEEADQAWELYQQNMLGKQIAVRLGCSQAKVSKLLKYASEKHGVPLEDGRQRRKRLAAKQMAPPKYVAIADAVKANLDSGMLIQEIADTMNVNKATVRKASEHWHESRGLTTPDGRTRRKSLVRKVSRPYRPRKHAAEASPDRRSK
jgi:transposase